MPSLNKPPRKKKETPQGPANPKDLRPGTREQPASAERTETPPESEKETRATAPDASTTTREPVTNQDEQDRITNAGEDRPVPEK